MVHTGTLNAIFRPSLADDLMGLVDTSLQVLYNSSDQIEHATLILRRCLKVLGAILKELAPGRLSIGVRNMKEVCISERGPNF
jgi:hypothetical protein